MNKDNLWKFASDHPIATFLIADLLITGAVNIVGLLVRRSSE